MRSPLLFINKNTTKEEIMGRIAAILLLVTVLAGCTSVNDGVKDSREDVVMEEKIVVLETTQGNVEFMLMLETAPKTCENFLGLVEKGYYDGIIFHRIIKNFMIQGGDPTGTGTGGTSIWGESFEDEVTTDVKFNRQGLLAMANSGPNTNGSQFFITTEPTPWLNMKHTIFGEVVNGYDVIEKLENTEVGPGDKPVVDQKIIKAFIK